MSQVMAPLWGHSRIYNELIAFSKSENPLFAPNVMNGLHNPRGDNLSATNPTNPFTLQTSKKTFSASRWEGRMRIAHHKLIVSPVIVYLKHNSLPHL